MKYIDLGLSSGTQWADTNVDGLYTFDEAVKKYGDSLPTYEQFKELMDQCKWERIDKGYRVTGHNGNTIVLHAAGLRFRDGNVDLVGHDGTYWTSSSDGTDDAYAIYFVSIGVDISIHNRGYGRSIRLVKSNNKNNDMKNKELNLVEILKDCPEGTPLYSPIFGNVTFHSINHHNDIYPIIVSVPIRTRMFTKDGRYTTESDGECMLFPSKDNRDWSTFNSSKKEYEFKPFDKVLFRDYGYVWSVGFFSHKTTKLGGNVVSYNIGGSDWDECIPYEGNEDLLGTTNSPDEKGGKE